MAVEMREAETKVEDAMVEETVAKEEMEEKVAVERHLYTDTFLYSKECCYKHILVPDNKQTVL